MINVRCSLIVSIFSLDECRHSGIPLKCFRTLGEAADPYNSGEGGPLM